MSNVIHGSGKPRFEIQENAILTNTVGSATATSVVLGSAVSLDELNSAHVLLNRLVKTTSTAGETFGRITAWVDGSDTISVESWNNGTPTTSAALTIVGFRIDLPFCQALIESWIPDFLSKKFFNGNVGITKRGFYYSAVLDYSQWMGGNIVEYLRPLYNIKWQSFIFYPRLDNTDVSYVVDISPDTAFQIRQARGHRGHKLVQIKLIGLRRLPEINLQTITTTGYGAPPYGGAGYGGIL